MVKTKGFSVHKAAKKFNVPEQTLRDRVLGKINPTSFGRDTMFTKEEEKSLVIHLQARAELGYGLTNTYTKKLAGEMAYELKKKTNNNPMSNKWLYDFLKRWENDIASLKPRQLETPRAKHTTPEKVDTYFKNLQTVLEENDLLNKPQYIFNLDETGIQPEHKPANVIANPNYKTQAITSPKSTTTTVIGCVNAMGNTLPPYFIFKGKRWNPDLMKGASAGANGTLSDSGWSNSDIFKTYLEDHFLPLVRPSTSSNQPILLLLDGHASHKSPETVKWAREHGIILFVLPAHSSHILQPLDVAIFGPFKKYYYSECAQYLYSHMGQTITRYDMCELACRAYLKALTPLNIQAGFKKTGIYPFNSDVVSQEQLLPCESFREDNPVAKVKAMKKGPEAVETFLQNKEEEIRRLKESRNEGASKYNSRPSKNSEVSPEKPNASGKEITSDEFYSQMINYIDQRNSSKPDQIKTKPQNDDHPLPRSPKPSTSGEQKRLTARPEEPESESDMSSEEEEEEKCCMCGKKSPPNLGDGIKIINWGKCDVCSHWVHLAYCAKERVIRRHSVFVCPHCKT